MVAISICPTTWTAVAVHPCWHSTTGHDLRENACVLIGIAFPLKSERAKYARSSSPEGLGATCAHVCTPATDFHSVAHVELAYQPDRTHLQSLLRCVPNLLSRATVSHV